MNTKAQSSLLLDRFNVYETNGSVYITCTISTGNTCLGIDVQRSTDSLNYSSIGGIEGICGDITEATKYTFVDHEPLINKKTFYRLEFGGNGYSPVISIYLLNTEETGLVIRPNPANFYTKVYFENLNNAPSQINLYNLQGRLVLTQKTKENYFYLDLSQIPSGLYPFSIEKETNIKSNSGRLMIQH